MELWITCLGATLVPAGVTVLVVRILIYQLDASPQRIERLEAILGLACLVWLGLAGLALWSLRACFRLPAPCASCFDPCTIRDLRLVYPVLFNAAAVFLYVLLHFLWALHHASHELW